MHKYQIRILAQYMENYAAHNADWDGIATAWKHKGGVEFMATVDSDFRMVYGKDEVTQAINDVLATKSNKVVNYTLIEFDYVDSQPEDITHELMKFAEDNYNQLHKVSENYPNFES